MGSFLTGATGTGNSFAAQSAPIQGQNFTSELGAAGTNFNQAFGNETSLANALQAQMSGAGPNPAALAAQQMNENAIKSNAGMVASQKGISPALAQEQAARNSASMQQQGAQAGAQMQTNQQLAVQGALGNLYGAQANQAAGQQSTLQNALAAYNNANVGMTSNMNNANEAVAGQNAQNSGQLFGGLATGGGSLLSLAKGGMVPPVQNYDSGGQVSQNWGYNLQPVVQQLASKVINGGNPYQSSSSGGSGSNSQGFLNSLFGGGGESDDDALQNYMDANAALGSGGDAVEMAPAVGGAADVGAGLGGAVGGDAAASGIGTALGATAGADAGAGIAGLAALAYKGGEIPDHLHQIAKIYHPDFAKHAQLKSKGGNVPGKPQIKGSINTRKNDTVPTMLSPGEIVLPRSVTQSKNPVRAAADFVAMHLKKSQGSGNHSADFHDALAMAVKTRRSK